MIGGFAGATADAFTLFERLERKLEQHHGQLMRAAVELAKDWRTDKYLSNLEAMMIVADKEVTLILTGNGDVLEPGSGVAAIGSGGNFALAAATALLDYEEDAETDRPQGDEDRRRHLRLHQRQSDRGEPGECELSWTVERLDWTDEPLGEIDLPKRTMRFRSGFGSGLSRRAADPPGVVWAAGDRGPNIKVKDAVKLYGLDRLEPLRGEAGAKIMPRLDLGPAIAELRVAGSRIELVRSLRIADTAGRPVSGLPVPGGPHTRHEPAFDLDGRRLSPDPSGLDTEGIAALADGGFWVSDEFGPSLVRLDGNGRVMKRLVPKGTDLEGAGYPVVACLPAIASRRKLNRGFEAIALSPDGKWLFVAFQSPLAHPDETAHEQARHVRLWRLESETGEVAAQYLYPLDPPETFRRDGGEGSSRAKRSQGKRAVLRGFGRSSGP